MGRETCAIMRSPIEARDGARSIPKVQDRLRIAGHVDERAWRPGHGATDRGLAQPQRQCWAADVGAIEFGGQSDVAVVEADNAIAGIGDLLAESLAPIDHLRAQSHDQQDRRCIDVAELVVTNLEVARRRGATALSHVDHHAPTTRGYAPGRGDAG